MDTAAEIAAELGEQVRSVLTRRGHNQQWLARTIGRSQGAVSKLLSGSWVDHGGVGKRLVKEVEVALGFPDHTLVTLFDEASGRRPTAQGPATGRVDVRPARELLSGSLLSDSWLRPLRCYLVAPAESRDEQVLEALGHALLQSAVEVVRCPIEWDTFDAHESAKSVVFAAACDEVAMCDVAILLVSRAHAETCGQARSTLEAFTQHLTSVNIPCLIATTAGAADFAYRSKHRGGIDLNIVDRLYRYQPDHDKPLTYFRVMESASTSALVREVVQVISSLTAASLFNLRAMSNVMCNDNLLEDIERASKETWVYTPDFYYELEDSRWRQVVARTLQGGGRYRWLFPHREQDRARLLFERIMQLTAEKAARGLSFFGLEDESLPWWPQVVIYDPGDPTLRQAFMYELWDRTIPGSCNYNYRLLPDNTGRLVREFEAACTEARRFDAGTSGPEPA